MMANQDQRNRSEHTPQSGNLDVDDAASIDENWQEEELERASMGWQGEDVEAPSTVPEINNLQRDDDDTEPVLDTAGEAITAMKAKEMRRGQFHTPGDDYNPGIDHAENAPKEDELPDRSRGKRT
jgi:hypothetical protein